MNDQKKKRGCLRTGCLTVVGISVAVVLAAWAMVSWGHRLPDRFILKLAITGPVAERPSDPVSLPFGKDRQALSLQELLTVMDRARTDSRVRSVLIDIDGLTAPAAKIGQLHRSIEGLRKSGKKVTAFLHSPEDKDYQLAVACDSVVVQQGSWLQLDGLKAEMFFLADPLRKLGVTFQASQWKKYKSAVEMFTRSTSSPESRQETGQLLDQAWDDYVGYVSARRHITREAYREVVDSLAVLSPEKARALGLVDRVSSLWQMEKGYERQYGAKASDIFVGARDYLQATGGMSAPGRGGTIAVINVTGPITGSGGIEDAGEGDGIDEASFRQAIRTAIEDRNVKAIVLRIDSPGGDAVAAANMLEMIDTARKSKPVVASMSGVAASGGYMVALGADRVLAEPLTLTGSIGVFALKPDFSALLQRTGVKREVVARGRYADAHTPFRPLDADAFRKFDETSGDIYRDFVGKVAARRHMSFAHADSLAGGRVWTGREALAAGLVDGLGGLGDAIRAAQKLAKMDVASSPSLLWLPAAKNWGDMLFGDQSSFASGVAVWLAERWFGASMPFGRQSPGMGTAGFLLRRDAPQVLALDPVEVIIR